MEKLTPEKEARIKELYGEGAYEQYLNAENAVKGKDHLPQIEREYLIGQSYEGANSYTKQQHRHIDQIVKGTEPTQEQIDAIAMDAAKNILG